MIHVMSTRIEIKWRRSMCLNFHKHIEKCGKLQYYWRVADEMDSPWRGPFDSQREARQDVEAQV